MEVIHKKINHVKSLLEEEMLDEQEIDLVEQIGRLLENILGDNWWVISGRLSRSAALFGTGYQVRYDLVKNNVDLRTVQGKGRLLIKHILHLGILTKVIDGISTLGMFPPALFLGSPSGNLAILSMARCLDNHTWTVLDLGNWCWLDTTWELPVEERHELVPAADLGVYITLVEGKPVVISVQAGSVAAEDNKVEIGDVITHINDDSVLEMNSTDKICQLINKGKGKPIAIKVTKAFNPFKQEIFSPLVPLLKRINIDVEELQRRYFFIKRGRGNITGINADEDFNPLEDEEEDMLTSRPGYSCLYLGSVNVGSCGDVDRIEFGMKKVMSSSPAGDGHPSVLQLQDIEVKLARLSSNELVFKFTYPQIASCGRLVTKPNYFAFITAPGPSCCHHTSYMCHVFYAGREEQVKEILSHISDGFQRTSFTV